MWDCVDPVTQIMPFEALTLGAPSSPTATRSSPAPSLAFPKPLHKRRQHKVRRGRQPRRPDKVFTHSAMKKLTRPRLHTCFTL